MIMTVVTPVIDTIAFHALTEDGGAVLMAGQFWCEGEIEAGQSTIWVVTPDQQAYRLTKIRKRAFPMANIARALGSTVETLNRGQGWITTNFYEHRWSWT
jgi:hypothetical protein